MSTYTPEYIYFEYINFEYTYSRVNILLSTYTPEIDEYGSTEGIT